MHPIYVSPFPVTPGTSSPARIASSLAEDVSRDRSASIHDDLRTLQLLSIGPLETHDLVLEALAEEHNFSVLFVRDLLELLDVSRERRILVSILHPSLEPFELEEVCRLIRRRWTFARILVIRNDEVCPEDALFDERLHPPVRPDILLSAVLRMTSETKEWRQRNDRR